MRMRLNHRGARLLQFIVSLATFLSLKTTYCEQYSSVDELARWSQETVKFMGRLDELVHYEEIRLSELRRVRESLMPLKQEVQSRTLMDPVHVFVTLNRLLKAINVVTKVSKEYPMVTKDEYEDESEAYDMEASNGVGSNYEHNRFKLQLEEDLRGSGMALLRLQAFYGLNLTHLIGGNVVPNGSPSFRMTAEDCFELGRIAYHDEQYGPAVVWLYASLELTVRERDTSGDSVEQDDNELIDEILDHMAFAAYKLGLLEYSAKLTRAWLERDPENERARENLEYYLDEMASNPSDNVSPQDVAASSGIGKVQNLSSEKYFQNYKNLSLDKYLVEDDEIVRRLCRQSGLVADTFHRCQTGPATFDEGYFYPGVRLETLSEDPKIVRIYDIISPKEVEHLQRLSRPRLQRSTIMLSSGQQTSDFRIAKTAWLRSDSDPIVKRIETRLASILNINMEQSELLQVVNYGLGGFYGPHLDSARASNSSRNDSVLVNQLKRSDRYATILIYLNDVDVGGSTVFPLLNLTVTPIGRSAIVWFNILDNGYSDERTLHTGCPVSLGSKWVAVKWPREEANTFPRGDQWWRKRSA